MHSSFYFAIIFCTLCLVLVDNGVNLATYQIKNMIIKREEEHER
jgi:hypothetical protein